jgi:hypothetical protein
MDNGEVVGRAGIVLRFLVAKEFVEYRGNQSPTVETPAFFAFRRRYVKKSARRSDALKMACCLSPRGLGTRGRLIGRLLQLRKGQIIEVSVEQVT